MHFELKEYAQPTVGLLSKQMSYILQLGNSWKERYIFMKFIYNLYLQFVCMYVGY